MKSSELKQIIREVVKEEVAEAVNNQMVKLVAQLLKESRNTPTNNSSKKSVVESITKPNKTNRTIITGNKELDDILSETTPFTKEQRGEFSQLMQESFHKVGTSEEIFESVSEPKSKMDYLKQIVSPTIQKQSVVDSAPPDIKKKLFNKDFSAILKRSKLGSGGGMFNPANVLSGDGERPTSEG